MTSVRRDFIADLPGMKANDTNQRMLGGPARAIPTNRSRDGPQAEVSLFVEGSLVPSHFMTIIVSLSIVARLPALDRVSRQI